MERKQLRGKDMFYFVTAVEDCGFFESIPLWAVTLIGGLFITVLSKWQTVLYEK